MKESGVFITEHRNEVLTASPGLRSSSIRQGWLYALEKAFSEENRNIQVTDATINDTRLESTSDINTNRENDKHMQDNLILSGYVTNASSGEINKFPSPIVACQGVSDSTVNGPLASRNLLTSDMTSGNIGHMENLISNARNKSEVVEKVYENSKSTWNRQLDLGGIEKIQVHVYDEGVHLVIFDTSFSSMDRVSLIDHVQSILRERNLKLTKITINGRNVWVDQKGINDIDSERDPSLTDNVFNKIY